MYTNKNLKVIEGHLCHGCVQSLRKATCAKVATPLCMQLSTDTYVCCWKFSNAKTMLIQDPTERLALLAIRPLHFLFSNVHH